MMICVRALVSGKVQGVYFRDHARKQAQALKLTGWVKNLPDGRVETIACGPPVTVMAFVEWLKQGSPAATVSEVYWEETSLQTYPDFTIRYDQR